MLDKITIEGYKSIRKLTDFELRPLNVLIGANGAGKSNLVGFFRLLKDIVEQNLQDALLKREGGADACLYLGTMVTQRLAARLVLGGDEYGFALEPTPDNKLAFTEERIGPEVAHFTRTESILKHIYERPGDQDEPVRIAHNLFNAMSRWVTYHFRYVSSLAGVLRQRPIHHDEVLYADASNLAALLFRIRKTDPRCYSRIRDVVRLAAPFFDDFKLRPVSLSPNLIQLEWLQKGSEYPFLAHQLSDGTLRFICIVTALLQPDAPPLMVFDEPELGLHPYALTLLAALFSQTADVSRQLIISTQSAQLVSELSPEDVEDIVVVERTNGESIFCRLESAQLSEWLKDYSVGELWLKNVLGGRPRREDHPS